MASNQIACLGQYQAAAFRAWKLGSDCHVVDTPNNVVASTGIARATLTPEIEEGTEISAKSAGGQICWLARDCDRIKGWTLDLELCLWDYELLSIMVGGGLLMGTSEVAAWQNKVVGWSAPGFNASCPNGVTFEIFSRVAYETGECPAGSVSNAPAYIRHIFPKVNFQLADRPFTNDEAAFVKLTGRVRSNPKLGLVIDSMGDWTASTAPDEGSAYIQTYATALPTTACGFQSQDIAS